MSEDPQQPEPQRQPEAGPLDTMGLARAAKAGELERFSELYERLAPALLTWSRLRIRPAWRAHIDETDVVQEVWCRAWRAFPDFDADRIPFRYWAFRIAKNVLLEASRKLRSSGAAAGTTTRLLMLSQVPDEATGLTQRVRRDEGLELFADWAQDLPEEDRKLLLHVGLEGLPHTEAAERLGISTEALSKRWQRLKQRIEEHPLPRQLMAD
jgi:RNA polymerase sigma factor (sigma-70 family)